MPVALDLWVLVRSYYGYNGIMMVAARGVEEGI